MDAAQTGKLEPSNAASGVRGAIPATLGQPGALGFWLAVLLTGAGAGGAAIVLTLLLQAVQHFTWPGSGTLVDAATAASGTRHILVLLGAGLLTGAGQLVLVRLSSGNGIDITEAISFTAGRRKTLARVAQTNGAFGEPFHHSDSASRSAYWAIVLV
jgi:hypothetical protein